ncbi:MAG TPA: efflux RND transporter permease subunit [Gemmatimonadaceae bacterium]|jgi:HAE1 family hydrophobic/amphiphilic exporter-1|nr:efflux RND transporter permease subunit [Gemmatimonadaceae bacterium]
MNFTTLFIKRPVMTTLVMVGILVFGIVAYRQLPVSDLPNVDFPTVTVSATLPGTSPQTMAATVATPLEKQFSTIAGIDNMTSTSSLGQTQIVIQFALDRNIDAAAQDVQAAIAQTARQLPQGIIPPAYQKTNPADAPILTLALTSSEVSLSTLDEIGETTIAQRLSMVGGVAQVLVYGAQKYAVRLQLDPGQLATRNIALEDVATSIQQQNVNMPTGVLNGPRTALTVQATGQLENANQFSDVIVAYRNGAPVHLDEIGRITDDVQNNKTASWFNGARSIVLAVQRQPGTNTVDVANRVKQALDKIGAEIPPTVQMSVLYDRSQTIKASVDDVTFTLELTLFLVVAVIFVFLRNWSATIIPSLALPMSIIGTFSVMYLLHYSLDNLSLMALTLAVGFVVDDAIVMLENIVRHMEMGKPKMQAAIDGASEVGFTILSMTFSLAAVFIPFLFMGGIIGKLFHEFAVTIGVAILVSGFVSLTLTPMLSSRFLKSDHGKQHGRLYQATESFYNGWLRVYERSLGWVMARRPLTLVFSFAILVATGYLFWSTPKGLFPTDDTGQLLATTEAQEGVSFDALVKHQAEVAEAIRRDPDVRSVTSSVGTTAAANQGQITIDLKPIEERKRSAQEIARDLMKATVGISDITTFIQNPPAISIGGLASKSLYQYTLQSGDMAALNTAAREMERRMRQIPGLIDVTSDMLIENPQVTIDIDREQAGQLGVSASEIENTLYDAFGQRQVSTIYTATNEYWVVMELLPEYQQDVDALGKLWVRSSRGPLVPLSTVAKFKYTVGPVTVNHSGQLPAVTVSFNLAPGMSIGTAVTQVETVAKDVLPAQVGASFSGMAEAFVTTQQGLLVLMLLAVFVIYVILGVLYESFIHPITILTGLPFAAFGALVTLILCGMDLDIYGFVGIIMLIGIVEKNAIMMIDFAIEAQRDGNRTPSDAILEAASVRFRPIMMTTMAALMGAIPIAVGWGAGASTRRPLGVAVVGGLAFSQLVTLYVTPVFYTYLDEWQQWMSRRRARSKQTVLVGEATTVVGD